MNAMRATVIDLLNPAISWHGEIGNGRSRVDIVNSTPPSTKDTGGGTSADYAIRRLKRDTPDLAAPG